MAPVHNRKFTQTTVNKPTGNNWFANWLCITSLLASTTARTNHNTLATADQNKTLQTILLANIFRNTNIEAAILHEILSKASNTKSKRSTADMDSIQKRPEIFHTHLEQTLARIEHNIQKNEELAKLAERISRSPRATHTVQTLEAAIATFAGNQPKPEYWISEYATGSKCWRHAPSVHPVPITDLLKYDVQQKHNKNKILGDKVAQVLQQNMDLSNKISEAYRTPSEKLGKDPVMALVSKMVATYMFIRHSKNTKNIPPPTEFSSWAEPFFKKKE
jgi:hypothetical protein